MDYMDEDGIKAPKGLVIFGKIIKWIFIIFVVLMLVWFAVCRQASEGNTKGRGYVFTEKAAEMLEKSGSLTVYDLLAYNDVAKDRNLTEKLFFTDHVMLTKEPSQIQFMLRYNLMNGKIKEYTGGTDTPFGLCPEGRQRQQLQILPHPDRQQADIRLLPRHFRGYRPL